MKKSTIQKVMIEIGRKGGKIGGKRCLETMTSEERTARAKLAAAASVTARAEKAAKKREYYDRSLQPEVLRKR